MADMPKQPLHYKPTGDGTTIVDNIGTAEDTFALEQDGDGPTDDELAEVFNVGPELVTYVHNDEGLMGVQLVPVHLFPPPFFNVGAKVAQCYHAHIARILRPGDEVYAVNGFVVQETPTQEIAALIGASSRPLSITVFHDDGPRQVPSIKIVMALQHGEH